MPRFLSGRFMELFSARRRGPSLLPRSSTVFRPAKSIDPTLTDISIQTATPLNRGRCYFDDKLNVITDPSCGGYSVLVPVPTIPHCSGSVRFRCGLDLQEGAIGLSAVTADCQIIAERVTTKRGPQQLQIIVPDIQKVGGILIRNLAATGCQSLVSFASISAEACPAELPIRIIPNRPDRVLRLPQRKQPDSSWHITSEPLCKIVDLNTRSTAAIVVDAWSDLGPLVATNLIEKLEPTLRALRSTGMAIVHAAHDREIHPLVRPLPGETEIPGEFHDTDIIADLLRDSGIRTLIYLGYFSNMCVLRRSIGMIEMKQRGFDLILVRDSSIAKESEDSQSGAWFHRAMIHFVELNIGASTTAAAIQAGVAAMCNHNQLSEK